MELSFSVYLSYHIQDQVWAQDIKTALAHLGEANPIHVIDPTQIVPGANIKDERDEMLGKADIVIALVSESYLRQGEELKNLLEKHQQGELILQWLPIAHVPSRQLLSLGLINEETAKGRVTSFEGYKAAQRKNALSEIACDLRVVAQERVRAYFDGIPTEPAQTPKILLPPDDHSPRSLFFKRLWSVSGLFFFYMSFNAYARTQQFGLDLPLFTKKSYEAAVLAIGFTAPFAFFLLWATLTYAKKQRSNHWFARIPEFWGIRFNFNQREDRQLQGLFFSLLVALPLAAQIHFTNKFFNGSFFLNESGSYGPTGWESLFVYVAPSNAFFNQWRYGHHEMGIEYYPFWGAWAIVLVQTCLLLYALHMIRSVFFHKPTQPVPSPFKGSSAPSN